MNLLSLLLLRRKRFRLLIIALSLGAAAMGLLAPYLQKIFIDHLLGETARFEWQAFSHLHPLALIGGAFVCLLIGQFFNLSAIYIGAREAIDIQRELSDRMYQRMLSFRTDTLSTRPVGEVVSIFASDVQGATILLEQSIPQLMSISFPLILAPIAIHWLYDIPLHLILTAFVCVIALNTVLATRQSRFFYNFKKLAAERGGLVNEWVQNMRTLRVLGWIPQFEKRIFAKREEETVNRVRMVTNGQCMNSISSTITFAINLIGALSIVLYSPHPITPSELMTLLWIFGIFLMRSFRQMPWFFTMTLDGLSSLNRLESFLAQTDQGTPAFRGKTVLAPLTHKQLAVRNLNLQLGGKSILKNIEFTIRENEFVAVVGEVGAGKSMLLLTLMGETGATFDSYQLDQTDALNLSTEQLRTYFGFVPQEGFVMTASLRDNVAFDYDTIASWDSQISSCLKQAQFDAQTELVAGGLNTEIGERGVNLSGGQRQRVSLARAAFFDRPILLLDDCLSAVDVETEHGLINDLFTGAWRDRTRILVTHRLTVLAKVDRIFFLQEGELIDSGSYEDLLARSEEFREFTASIAHAEQRDGFKEKQL